ncbi:MAG: M16 family metallopeptidase [Rhodospirillaceae bacterium]
MRKFFLLAIAVVAFAAPASALTVREVKSKGGISAYLSEDHTTPIIAITFGFKGGSAIDPDAKLGLSGMVTSLLDEGAGQLDSFAFQTELQDRAITLQFSADNDYITGKIVTTTPNAGKAYELLRLALTQPRFDQEPVERIRRQILVSIQSQLESPGRIAGQRLMEELFGKHPYAREDDGTPASIKAITTDDLRGWVKSRLARDRLVVGVSGDITAAQLQTVLDQVFGTLPATSGLKADVPPAPIVGTGKVVRIAKNLPQSVVYIGQKGLMREDPDWYTGLVVDYVFGGGSFQSRLMDEVREKRGLAYSVGTGMAPYDAGAAMMASVGTRADQAEASLQVIRDEWVKMRDAGPTQQELNDAKQYLTGAWPLRFTSTGSIADTLLAVQRDNLGLDYIDKRNSYIESVTLEQAKALSKKLYEPDNLVVVVVGPDLSQAKPGAAPAAKPAPAKAKP